VDIEREVTGRKIKKVQDREIQTDLKMKKEPGEERVIALRRNGELIFIL